MTVARRLAAVEDSLTPTQCVLRWMNEAHAHGSLSACIDATLDQALENFPVNRLCREAERAARSTDRSRNTEQIERAVRKARRETVFRFELILRINVTAHEILEKEEMLQVAAVAVLALLGGEGEEASGGARHHETLAQVLGLLLSRVAELEAAGQARTQAEQQYLDACPALFPDTREAWVDQVRATREVAVMAVRLVELDGVDLPRSEDEDAISDRAAVLLADLVEPAKAIALEKLGEGERAHRIITGWLRTKLDRTRAATEADSAPEAPTL